jgi:hypothetical protein
MLQATNKQTNKQTKWMDPTINQSSKQDGLQHPVLVLLAF